MLEVINYSKKYDRSDRYSAKDISFTVDEGEVVGLVGSNGAGKSTTIKSIVGILPFGEGKISVDGHDIVSEQEAAKRLIGYVPDDHSVYEKLTGREYVNYMGSLYKATKEQKEFAVTELASLFEISHALDVQIANYSHGMRQKICILGALVHEPRLWILDEPMVGLDPQTMLLLRKYIRKYANNGHMVLFSSHNLDVVKKTCDKVVFIRKGEVASVIDLRDKPDFDLDTFFYQLNEVKEAVDEMEHSEDNATEPAVLEAAATEKKEGK